MPVPSSTILRRMAVSAILSIILAGLGLSCSPGDPEVDKAALYTPDSLASELAYRYQQLNPDTKAKAVQYRHRPRDEKKIAERLARAEQAKNKAIGGAPARKKQTGPPTLDDLLADIDSKLDLIEGISRADACREMKETLSADASLPASDKERLSELIGKLEGSD